MKKYKRNGRPPLGFSVKMRVVMHYCDIFRATRSSFISCYTYFGEIFCQTHFLRHLFSHLFCETSAYRRRPIFEFRTTRKQTHSPSSFLQAYCRECVAVQCIFKKSALRAHTVAIEAKKHNTRFKQDSNKRVLCFPFLFLFGSGSVHILYSYERTEDKIQALQQFTNKSGSVFHFPVWFWFC